MDWIAIQEMYFKNNTQQEFVQIKGSTGKLVNVMATTARRIDLSYADRDVFQYENSGNPKIGYILKIAKGDNTKAGIVQIGSGLESTDGVVSVALDNGLSTNVDGKVMLNISSKLRINEENKLDVVSDGGLALINKKSNFKSKVGVEILLDKTVLSTDEYLVNIPVPTSPTDGTLGEVWIEKQLDKFIVFNSGSFEGSFEVSFGFIK